MFFSDIVGYTRLMGSDEDGAYDLMKQNLNIHEAVFEKYNGKVIKELGDGILGTFEHADDACSAGIEIQKAWQKRGDLELRIGLHAGEIIHDRGDVFGDAVNVASRIQSIGVPSCVIFSEKLKNLLTENADFPHVKLGQFKLKNVQKGLTLYALSAEPLVVPRREQMINTIKYQERKTWRYWVGIGLLIAIIGVLAGLNLWGGKGNNWTKEKSIAVLPLKNLNADAAKEYFSDGLTEDIITHLSRIQSLRVISRSSVALYKNSSESNQEIALALGVSTLLEGSVQWAGEALRIRVRLIDAATNETLWAETFDPDQVEDLFLVQTTIAETIAKSLEADVSMSELEQIQERPTASFDAYQEYLEGRGLYYEYQLEENKQSIQSFKDAIDMDATFALAWAGLGDAYAQMYGLYNFDTLWLDSSIVAGKRAIEINPRLVEGHKALGSAYYYNSQYVLAQEYLEKAVELSPNHAQAVGNLATIYFISGELDKSLQLQKKAVDLNPKSFIPFQVLGWNYRLLENQTEAQRWLKSSIALRASFDTYEQLGLSLLTQGKKDSVEVLIGQIDRLVNGDPYVPQAAGTLAYMIRDTSLAKKYFEQAMKGSEDWRVDPYFYSPIYLADILLSEGKTEEANRFINLRLEDYQLELERDEVEKEFAVFVAALYLMKGEKARALEYLALAKEMRFQDYQMLEINPLFDALRDDPSFILLIEEIKSDIRLMILNSNSL